MEVTLTITYNSDSQQSSELAKLEITETLTGLANSLRTQVKDVQVNLKFKEKED